MPPSAKYLVFVASFSLGICDAFVTPRAFATTSSVAITAQNAHPIDVLLDPISSMSSTTSSLILLSDETVDALADVDTASLLSGLRTFFVVITALVFGLFGITYIIAAFIVPKAAEQLEADTRRLRPGLWEEYEAKLEPGQTMATRPDILQELGDVMRPIIIADFEESARREEEAKKSGVDAVVEKKEDNSIGESPPGTRLDTNDQWKD